MRLSVTAIRMMADGVEDKLNRLAILIEQGNQAAPLRQIARTKRSLDWWRAEADELERQEVDK